MRILHARRRSVLTRSLIGAGLLTALVGSFGAGACTVFDTEPTYLFDGSASGGAGGSGGEDPGPPLTWFEKINERGCRVASAPTPEQAPDESKNTASQPEFSMAMTYIRLGYTGPPAAKPTDQGHLRENEFAYREIGLDLDGKCSSSATCRDHDAGQGGLEDAGDAGAPLITEQSCIPGAVANGAVDGTYCRDNAVGYTIPISYNAGTTSGFFGVNENDWNCELQRGGFGVMFRIRNYNHLADDPQVTVDIYLTMGITDQPTWHCRGGFTGPDMTATTYGDWRNQPLWSADIHNWIYATSNWDADTGGADSLPDSKVHTENAYVKEGYLVAFLPPTSNIGFIGKRSVIPGIRLIVERGILVGRLIDDPEDGWSLENAMLVGAVDPATMVDSFEKIGYCKNIMCASYDLVRNVLTGVRDINLNPANADPTKPCDGMSIGMALGARQAKADGFRKESEGDEFLTDCPEPRHPLMKQRFATCDCVAGEAGEALECREGGAGGTGGTGGTGGNGDGG